MDHSQGGIGGLIQSLISSSWIFVRQGAIFQGRIKKFFRDGLKRAYLEVEEEVLAGSATLQPAFSNEFQQRVCLKDK